MPGSHSRNTNAERDRTRMKPSEREMKLRGQGFGETSVKAIRMVLRHWL